jgi:DNA-binding MarR family transcriptional regulator
MPLSQTNYQRLLAVRSGLRRFLHWSEEQARESGLTPAQHQLLLAIAGHPGPTGPAIGDVAEYLALRHHSAVGLIDRAGAAGLVTRRPDEHNHSVIRLALTEAGLEKLDRLTEAHVRELKQLAPAMRTLWEGLDGNQEELGQSPTAAPA